jgi:hypothetical protein
VCVCVCVCAGVRPLLQRLAQGACPGLQELDMHEQVSTAQHAPGPPIALPSGLTRRPPPPLHPHKHPHRSCLDRESFTAIAETLAAGRLPHLRRLNLADNSITYEGMQVPCLGWSGRNAAICALWPQA